MNAASFVTAWAIQRLFLPRPYPQGPAGHEPGRAAPSGPPPLGSLVTRRRNREGTVGGFGARLGRFIYQRCRSHGRHLGANAAAASFRRLRHDPDTSAISGRPRTSEVIVARSPGPGNLGRRLCERPRLATGPQVDFVWGRSWAMTALQGQRWDVCRFDLS